MTKTAPTYDPKEERINVFSHAFGFLLSVVAFIMLLQRSWVLGTVKEITAVSIFGASLILLYAASTFYHSAKHPRWRYVLNIIDHASIYILIAGTYTPFALVTLSNDGGMQLFVIIWAIALAGIVFKLFFIGHFRVLSTILYVAMGWLW